MDYSSSDTSNCRRTPTTGSVEVCMCQAEIPRPTEYFDTRVVCHQAWRTCLSDRQSQHSREVIILTQICSDMKTLIVGPGAVRIQCNESVLAYFSRFFKKTCKRVAWEAPEVEYYLPDHEPELVAAYVEFANCGKILTTGIVKPEKIWVYSLKIGSIGLRNEAIQLLMSETYEEWRARDAGDADWILENCVRTPIGPSTLEVFLWAQVLSGGPVDSRRYQTELSITRPLDSLYDMLAREVSQPRSAFECRWFEIHGIFDFVGLEIPADTARRASPHLCFNFPSYFEDDSDTSHVNMFPLT